MNLELKEAKDNVEKYRFVEDTIHESESRDLTMINQLEGYFSHSDLRISKSMTPNIDRTIQKVLKRLKIPKDSIKSFVYSSYDINAQCFSGDSDATILRFSSRLIELLNQKELEFIVGHEIGHFLFGHNCEGNSQEEMSSSQLMDARAQELSSDRIGYVACKDIDSAVRAMIKVSSGLSSKHLRFDATAFLNQLDQTSQMQKYNNQLSTHPSMLLRCRGLFWFSLNDDSSDLEVIDNQIIKDLKKYVDGPLREEINNKKDDYAYWYMTSKIIEDNLFDKKEQEVVRRKFGSKKLSKLKSFLENTDSHNRNSIIYKNREKGKKLLMQLTPKRWENYLIEIEENIDLTLRGQ